MTTPSLTAALRAGCRGLYALEATAGLIIAHGTWLAREDFECYIHRNPGTAAIDGEELLSPQWTPVGSRAWEENAECRSWQQHLRPDTRQPRRGHGWHRQA